MTYIDFINNILNTRGRFACGEKYHERHHILPRCCGGDNSEDNLIDLYPREHYIAHKLLADENPDNHKLLFAAWLMSHDSKGREVNEDEYEDLKIRMHEAMSGDGNPMYGKTRTDECKRVISEKLKGRGRTPESCAKTAAGLTGIKRSEETRKKMSAAVRKRRENGWTPGSWGRPMSDETKKKISLKNGGSANKRSIPVICETTGVVYASCGEAQRMTGIDRTVINRCCNGKQATAGEDENGNRLVWKFYNNNN